MILRFTFRKARKKNGMIEVTHFYASYGKVFHVRCEHSVIFSFIERLNGKIRRSKTIHLEGNKAEDTFRRLIMFAGSRQCIRKETTIIEVSEIIASLREFETIFWCNTMLEGYENRGY